MNQQFLGAGRLRRHGIVGARLSGPLLSVALLCGIGVLGGQAVQAQDKESHESEQIRFNDLLKQNGWASERDSTGNLLLYRLPTDRTAEPEPSSALAADAPQSTALPKTGLMQLIAKLRQAGWRINEDGAGGLLLVPPTEGIASTPLRAVVEALPDEDGDRVADDLDLCVGSGKGQVVNTAGCPAGRPLLLEGVYFRSGSSRLTAEAKRELDIRVAVLLRHGELRLTVLGHTDSVGGAGSNLRLSRRRASSVRAYLVEQGIAAEKVEAEGRGERQPIADNSTHEGRRMNRRVELLIAKAE